MDSQKQFSPAYSCEFFPPRTDKGRSNLATTISELAKLNPAYFSCTYGAGGTTQEGTYDVIKQLTGLNLEAAPHITCVGSSREKIHELLDGYKDLGIKRIVALRGDLPEGIEDIGEFHFANELITFIREQFGDHFHIEVAAYPEKHPEAADMSADLTNFKRKVDAGANAAITQFFYDINAYTRFVDACEKLNLNIPIVPGIMPITNNKQLLRFSDNCGAIIPPIIRSKLEDFGDDLESICKYGEDVVTDLCQQLLDVGAPGLHFYTLNRSGPTTALWNNLGLKN